MRGVTVDVLVERLAELTEIVRHKPVGFNSLLGA
jgi:hypothetical protein